MCGEMSKPDGEVKTGAASIAGIKVTQIIINDQGELQNVLLSVPGMQLSPDLLTVEQAINIP